MKPKLVAVKNDEADNAGYTDELQPGTKLLHGQYTIEKFLNSGGFGITYLAKDSLNRDIVIKECFPGSVCRRSRTLVAARSRAHTGEYRSIVKLFMEEARNQSKLVHPNIVAVHQVFEDNDTAYMAIDYVKGRDLLEIIQDKKTTLMPDQTVTLHKKVLKAVAFMHGNNVLHRDISPDNILINEKDEPILIDFGAAREEVSKASRALSALRVVKDGYSPQEFYVDGSAQTDSSDLFALGATFYHVITGDTPPNSQARLAAIAEGVDDPYVPLTGNYKGYPEGYLESIDKSLMVLPKDRIQKANEWLGLLGDTEVLDDAARAAINKAEPEKSNKTIVVLLGTAAAIAVIGGVVAMQFMGPSPQQPDTPTVQEVAEAPQPTPVTEPEVAVTEPVVVEPETVQIAVAEPVVAEPVEEPAVIKGSETTPTPEPATPQAVPEVEVSEPAVIAAVIEPSPEPTANNVLGADEVLVFDATKATTTQVQEITPAPQQITQASSISGSEISWSEWRVDMPFIYEIREAKGDIFAFITATEAGLANEWAQKGSAIYTINGEWIYDDASMQQALTVSPEIGENGLLSIPVTFKTSINGTLDEAVLSVPGSRVVTLKDGTAFEVKPTAGNWQTVVTNVGGSINEDGLRVGDILVSEATTGESLQNPLSVDNVISTLSSFNKTEAVFTVARNGSIDQATLALQGGGLGNSGGSVEVEVD